MRNDPNANIIRTLKDFDATVVLNTPLSKLSQKDLVDFKSNIVFRKGVGVVGLKYGKLQRNLSYDDFAKVLSMFGMDVKEGYWGFSKDPAIQAKLSLNNNNQAPDNNNNPLVAELPKDYIGYYCISIKTCKKSADYICMSGC